MKKILINILLAIITIVFLAVIIVNIFIIRNNTEFDNSSWILAFLTYLYVLLTFFILKSNNKLIQEQIRPYVIVSFPIKVSDVILSIKNLGKRPAFNVKITIDPDISIYQDEMTKGNFNTYLDQNMIAPRQRFECYLTDAFDLVSDKGKQLNKVFLINIKYEDSNKNKFSDVYNIDLSSMISEKDSIKPNKMNILEGIQKELSILNRKMDFYLKQKKSV